MPERPRNADPAPIVQRGGPLATSEDSRAVPALRPDAGGALAKSFIAPPMIIMRATLETAKSGWLRRGHLWSFVLLVILPGLAAAGWLGLIASPRYTAEFRAGIHTAEPIQTGGIEALLGMSALSRTNNDSYAIVQYLQSREGFDEVSKTLPVRQSFEAGSVDWFSRLRAGAPVEEVNRFWRRMIDAYFEPSTGTIVVRATAFDRDMAAAVAQRCLSIAEAMVNRMSERVRDDTVVVAQQEVASSEDRLRAATQRLQSLQDKFRVLNPQKSAEASLTLETKLRDEIARLKAQLSTQMKYLAATSPGVQMTRATIASLEDELASIDATITNANPKSAGGDAPLSSVLASFSELESNRLFAEKAYQSALASLEAARVEARRQQVFLQTIVSPQKPQEASFPAFGLNMAEVLGVLCCLWLIGAFVAHGVREHL